MKERLDDTNENHNIGYDFSHWREVKDNCDVIFWSEIDKNEFIKRFQKNRNLGIIEYIFLNEKDSKSIGLRLNHWMPDIYSEKYQQCFKFYKNTNRFWRAIIGSIANPDSFSFFYNDKEFRAWERANDIVSNNKLQ